MSALTTTHVIFDFAGTLVDLFSKGSAVLQEFALRNGKPLSMQDYDDLPEMESSCDGLDKFLEKIGFDQNKSHCSKEELKKNLFKSFLSTELELVDGVQPLLKHLYGKGIQMAIATNMTRIEFESITKLVKGFDMKYFSHFVCGGDDPQVNNNKPAPDVYKVCAQRFVKPLDSSQNCVIFEDSLIGITGAVATGMKTVLIKDKLNHSFDTILNSITVYVKSFKEFSPEMVGLPGY